MEVFIGQPVESVFFLDRGAWQCQGCDENGLGRSLNGRLFGTHQVLCSAGEITCRGRQDSFQDSMLVG